MRPPGPLSFLSESVTDQKWGPGKQATFICMCRIQTQVTLTRRLLWGHPLAAECARSEATAESQQLGCYRPTCGCATHLDQHEAHSTRALNHAIRRCACGSGGHSITCCVRGDRAAGRLAQPTCPSAANHLRALWSLDNGCGGSWSGLVLWLLCAFSEAPTQQGLPAPGYKEGISNAASVGAHKGGLFLLLGAALCSVVVFTLSSSPGAASPIARQPGASAKHFWALRARQALPGLRLHSAIESLAPRPHPGDHIYMTGTPQLTLL